MATSKPKKKADEPVLVLTSRVKDVVKSMGMRSDSEFVGDLSSKVHALIQSAVERAKQNKRSTVRGCDLA